MTEDREYFGVGPQGRPLDGLDVATEGKIDHGWAIGRDAVFSSLSDGSAEWATSASAQSIFDPSSNAAPGTAPPSTLDVGDGLVIAPALASAPSIGSTAAGTDDGWRAVSAYQTQAFHSTDGSNDSGFANLDAVSADDLHAHGVYATGAHALPEDKSLPEPKDYAVLGTKWGSSTFGTGGGTVTWSVAGAGWNNATGQSFFSGSSVALSSFLSFDYVSVLAQAFSAWSAVANITFLQVTDGGGNFGVGTTGQIRIGGGYIDGYSSSGSIVGRGYQPGTSAASGDIVFDSAELSSYWTANNFLAVAAHEIGHAIGLDHTSVANSLMNPTVSTVRTPQADDIAGAQYIYGAPAAQPTLSVGDVSITEGDSGTRTAIFTVTRSGGTGATSVNYATVNGTATAGSDYVATSGTLSFATGQTTATVSVTINGDTTVEPDETFFLNLSGAQSGTVITGSQGVGTIVNDDLSDDYPADTTTVATVGLGARGHANIETAGDHDWFGVQLTAGVTYQFDIRGTSSGGGTLSDPILSLRDGSGTSLAFNDDTNGLDPQINYTATATGRYYLDVSGYSGTSTGSYGIDFIARNQLARAQDFDINLGSDILWRAGNGAVATWQGINSTSHAGQSFGIVGTNWTINDTGDFNGDNRSDMVWRSNTGDVATWENLSGSQHGGVSYGNVGMNWIIRGTGDFNLDGRSDLIWRSTGGDVVTWDNMQTNGTHGGVSYGNVGPGWHIVGTGDFDSDQRSDILWRSDNGDVVVWTNLQANGTHGGFTLGNVGAGWHIEGTGDFNVDGRSDILWRSSGGDVVTWENILANGTHGGQSFGNVGLQWSIVDVGDFGSDGQSDMLWRGSDGTLVTWEHMANNGHDGQTLGVVGLEWSVQDSNYEYV